MTSAARKRSLSATAVGCSRSSTSTSAFAMYGPPSHLPMTADMRRTHRTKQREKAHPSLFFCAK